MSRLLLIAIIFLYFTVHATFAQQIQIDDSFTEQQLVEEHLVQGCVEISNIESRVNGSVNNLNSFGYFQKGDSDFPFDNGIILTTGRAASGANGVNNSILNEGESSWLTDPDLENTLGITGTLNATSIEFDFISTSNQISFNYILASEEYFGNFPCEYSDGFALLVKRADVAEPFTNIAVIPNTNIPVNTKTIHDEIVGFCEEENSEYFDGYSLGDTNYNGRTTVLTASAAILPNVKYHIKLVIADQTDKNYDSAVFIEGNSFSATVDLGEDVTSCAESYTLDADIGNDEATYAWFLDNNEISGETATTLDIATSGTYKVEVTLPFLDGFCTIEDSIEMNLSSTQTAEELTDFQLCDEGNDGVEIFDLSLKTDEVIASVPESDYEISYHTSYLDAENNSNPVTQPIQNTGNPQTIFVRIRDIINGCLAYSTFNLVVNERPNIDPVTDYYVCDDGTADGITSIDFEDLTSTLSNGDEILIATYYQNFNDAQNAENAISLPYTNNSPNETLYANVTNSETGCASVTTINFEVKGNPVINREDVYLDACDKDYDGYATFDLTSVINEITNGQTGVSITFHRYQNDANNDTDAIANPEDYTNESPEVQNIYIRVEDDITGCASVRSFEIHTNLLLTGTTIRDFALCEAEGNSFDLQRIALIIANEIDDISIDFYETEAQRDSNTNAIDQGANYNPDELPKILYININSPTCQEASMIELLLDPSYDFSGLETLNFCDVDQDGSAVIDLSQFDADILNGETGYIVEYYETYDDAEARTNILPTEYQNTSNPQTIYVRINAEESLCYDVVDFELNLLGAPNVNQPTDIAICNNGGGGVATINLDEKLQEITTETVDREIAFYTSQEDADEGINPIVDTANFTTATQEIFVKISDAESSCSSMVSFNIYVNDSPTINTIVPFEYCEFQSDGIGSFILQDKDAEITNGENDYKVSYYLTEDDASNSTNPINKSQSFTNTSNPQTIFVKVESETDSTCATFSSFDLVVGSSPEFNQPDDWFVCDDVSNDQRETFDLNTRINAIRAGASSPIEITLHESFDDAQSGISAIDTNEPYTNSTNPQTIFARIGNGNVCNEITSFELNVVQVPDANDPEPLIICDADYDESVSFNLEDALVNILDVRQDNIELSYYTSLEDLDTQENAIGNPTNFTNTSNPQTVFLRLTNTVSNCYNAVPIELIVGAPPITKEIDTLEICKPLDGKYDLSIFKNLISDNITEVEITFYSSENHAINKSNVLVMPYSIRSSNDTVFVRTEDLNTGCFKIDSFILKTNELPIANKPNDLIACDDDFDGYLEFDLGQQIGAIVGNQDAITYSIAFFKNQVDAFNDYNEVDINYTGQDQEIIYAKVTNKITGCMALTDFRLVLNPLPYLDIGNQAICPEVDNLIVSANTNIAGDDYYWSTGETTPEIEIHTPGEYTVTVTTSNGCQQSETFTVVESEPATIETTEVIDFSDPNNIKITVSGIGNYAYQLDDNEPQSSNVFDHVSMGYHTVTVIDLNGCSNITKEVLVIDTPKFMTPNGDGYWDHWHIVGIETLPGTVVQIFDRYGKRMTELQWNEKGWDGNYNGKPMPATDYWFVADVIQGGFEFQVKGHFALRR